MSEKRTTIGEYEIRRELGRGGMGVVYKARDIEKSIDVAVKTIPPELAHHPEFLRRFQQEARALTRLNHPNIVRLLDLLRDQGSHYLVLEYVDGPSLSQLLTKGPLPPERAREIALQVADALSHAHAHDIVHRDIKPSNILLTKEGQVKVTDFGIARVLDATLGTVTGQVFGTVQYASPEQVKGLKVDARSDLYSLGVVLYEMMTGRAPFVAKDDMEIAEQHLTAMPVRPRELREDIPQGLEGIILRCLQKDRESRYQTAEELAADLRKGAVSERAQVGEEARDKDSRRRLVAVVGVIALVLLIGLGVLGLVVWPRFISGGETSTPSAGEEAGPVFSPIAEEPPATPEAVDREVVVPTPTPFVGKIAFLSGRDYPDFDPQNPWRRAELYTMNPNGTDQRRLSFGDEAFFDSGVPPRRVFWLDERRVVVDESGVGDRALIFDTVDGAVERVIQFNSTLAGTDVSGHLMDWSPDGTKVAFDAMYFKEPSQQLQCAILTSGDDGSNWDRITEWGDNCDYGPVWSPDGIWLAFARLTPRVERGLYLIHPDGTGLRLLAGGFDFGDTRAWSADGRMIASDAWVDSVFDILLVDVATGSVRNLTNTADREEWHPSWSPDGTQIAFEVGGDIDGEIWIMDADGSDAHKIADGCCPGWQPAPEITTRQATDSFTPHMPTATYSPISGRIAFGSERDGESYPEIYVINADGSGLTRLTNNPAGDYYPACSPDGSRVAFESDGHIYVMNTDGSGVTRLTHDAAWHSGPTWSPDGKRIAFTSDRGGNTEIYVMNTDGSGLTKLTNHSAHDLWPSWSPDATRIAFESYRDDDEIYVMNVDGSGVTRLTYSPGIDGSPSWSPDGTLIAFMSSRDGNNEIYVINSDGSGVTRLTNNPAYDWDPCWSPDGTLIAFASNRDGNWEIYVMNADGSGVTRLTDNPADDWQPSWSPR